MLSSVIPARLVFQCGHAALVSLPRIKGETSTQRADRVAREKSAAQTRACDFCAQRLEVVVQQAAPAPPPASLPTPAPTPLPPVFTAASVPEPVVPVAPVTPTAAPAEPARPATRRPYHRRNGGPTVKRVEPAAAPPPAAVTPVAVPLAERPVVVRRRRAAQKAVVSTAKRSAPSAVVKKPVAAAAKKPVGRPRGKAIRVGSSAQNGRVARGARFTVQFQAQAVLHAADLRDALRQAQALGAIEVVAITREN